MKYLMSISVLVCLIAGSQAKISTSNRNQQCSKCHGCSIKDQCMEYNPDWAKPYPHGKSMTRKQFFGGCINDWGGIDCSETNQDQQCSDCPGCSLKGECFEYNPKMAKPDSKGNSMTRKQFSEGCIKNGGIDCSETNQACEDTGHACPGTGQFNGKSCIPIFAMCDGRPDCEDHSDENNCADEHLWTTRWQYNDTLNCEDQYPSCSGWENAGYCNNIKIFKKYPYAETSFNIWNRFPAYAIVYKTFRYATVNRVGAIETDNFLKMSCAKTCDACKGCTDSLWEVMPKNPQDCPPIDCAALIRTGYGRGCHASLRRAFTWMRGQEEVYPSIGGKVLIDRRSIWECERSLAPEADDDGRAAGGTSGDIRSLKKYLMRAKVHQFCNLSCNKCGKGNNMPNGGQCRAADECSSGTCTMCPDVLGGTMKCGLAFGTPCTSDDQCCGGHDAVCGAHTRLCERVHESYRTAQKDDLCSSQGFYEILSPAECGYAIHSLGFWANDQSVGNSYKAPKDFQACFFGSPNGIRICKAQNQYEMNCHSRIMHDITVAGATITLPKPHNKYDKFKDCKITIRFAFNQAVRIRLEKFDVEPFLPVQDSMSNSTCNEDYLAVHEGDSISYPMTGAKLCGSHPTDTWYRKTVQSTGNVITLHFHSDYYVYYHKKYRFEIHADAVPNPLPIDEFAGYWKVINDGQVLPNIVMESTSNSTLKLWPEGQPERQMDPLTWDGDKTFTWGMMGAAQGTYDGISTIKWQTQNKSPYDGLEFIRIVPDGKCSDCNGCLNNGQCIEYNPNRAKFRDISEIQFIQECIRVGGTDCSECKTHADCNKLSNTGERICQVGRCLRKP